VEEALGEQPAAKSSDDQAAQASQGDDLPAPNITFGPMFDSINIKDIDKMYIHRVGDPCRNGWKLGKTVGEVLEIIKRKKAEEAARAGALVEDALSEQAAAENGDVTEGDAIECKKPEED